MNNSAKSDVNYHFGKILKSAGYGLTNINNIQKADIYNYGTRQLLKENTKMTKEKDENYKYYYNKFFSKAIHHDTMESVTLSINDTTADLKIDNGNGLKISAHEQYNNLSSLKFYEVFSEDNIEYDKYEKRLDKNGNEYLVGTGKRRSEKNQFYIFNSNEIGLKVYSTKIDKNGYIQYNNELHVKNGFDDSIDIMENNKVSNVKTMSAAEKTQLIKDFIKDDKLITDNAKLRNGINAIMPAIEDLYDRSANKKDNDVIKSKTK